jgi:hypothetical protein
VKKVRYRIEEPLRFEKYKGVAYHVSESDTWPFVDLIVKGILNSRRAEQTGTWGDLLVYVAREHGMLRVEVARIEYSALVKLKKEVG